MAYYFFYFFVTYLLLPNTIKFDKNNLFNKNLYTSIKLKNFDAKFDINVKYSDWNKIKEDDIKSAEKIYLIM